MDKTDSRCFRVGSGLQSQSEEGGPPFLGEGQGWAGGTLRGGSRWAELFRPHCALKLQEMGVGDQSLGCIK